MSPHRKSLAYLGWAVAVMALGVASRRFGAYLPEFLAAYAGDTLWALLVFLGISAVAPNASRWHRGGLAATFALLIELSQLYHPPWLDALRDTTLGGLVLGFGFLWSDLVCYATGVGIGLVVDWTARSPGTASTP